MSAAENRTDIMERIRRRKVELGEGKENCSMRNSDEESLPEIERGKPSREPGMSNREIFAKIAADHDNYDCSPTQMAAKEPLIKGGLVRLPYEEERVGSSSSKHNASLRGSSESSYLENGKSGNDALKRIQFAQPISATTIYAIDSSMSTVNESTILAGSEFNSEQFAQSSDLPHDITYGANINVDNGDECSLQYGAHTFMKKKTPMKSTDSSSSLKLTSPKPFSTNTSSSTFSPVQFNPTSTSSPLKEPAAIIWTEEPLKKYVTGNVCDEVVIEEDMSNSKQQGSSSTKRLDANLSPIRAVAIENAKAKNFAKDLEELIRKKGASIPTPCSIALSNKPSNCVTPTKEAGFRTMWRGTAGTPIVSGTSTNEAPLPSNLRSLRDRWEFSSKTGTPIHPDKSEAVLVKDALIRQQTSLPQKHTKASDPQDGLLTPKTTEIDNSPTSSPKVKSTRYMCYDHTPPNHPISKPETPNTPSHLADEYNLPDGNISRLFDFLSESPAKQLTPDSPCCEQSLMTHLDERRDSDMKESYVVEETHLPEEEHDITLGSSHVEGAAASLPYSISFYRKRGRMNNLNEPGTEVINLNKFETGVLTEANNEEDDEEKECDRKERLLVQSKVQQTVISQVKMALRHCKSQEPFRGSREEVEAHRSLLLAMETKYVLEHEMEKNRNIGRNRITGPIGSIVINEINVFVQKEFLRSFQHCGSNAGMTCYFIILLKLGERVSASSIISIEEVTKDCLEFGPRSERDQPLLSLENVSPDFQCIVEVYKLMAPKEQFSHEEKYRIKGSMKNKTLLRSIPPSGLDIDSSFQSVGHCVIDINTPIRNKKHHFDIAQHPLDNDKGFVIRMKKRAMEQANVEYKGFLSMYQRTKEGLGSWNRYYCALESSEMKFWKSPEDQANNKSWLVLLDLHTCVAENGEGARPVEETCFLYPFHIDVWVPKDDIFDETMRSTASKPSQNVEKLRVMLAAGTKQELQTWLHIINETVRHIAMWGPAH